MEIENAMNEDNLEGRDNAGGRDNAENLMGAERDSVIEVTSPGKEIDIFPKNAAIEYLKHFDQKIQTSNVNINETAVGNIRAGNLILVSLLEMISQNNHLLQEITTQLGKQYSYNIEIYTRRVIVPSAGTPKQLPRVEIPFDRALVIKALSGNAGTIYVGNGAQEANDTSIAFPLQASESVSYKIKYSDQIWIGASSDGDGVAISVELVRIA